jgi:hypothetical protein
MKNMKLCSGIAAVSGALLLGLGANAMADTSTDIVNALVAKGVLTEEEGALITKGREGEKAGEAKALKSAGKIKISDAIDNATIYGDVRVRAEHRDGSGIAGIAGTNVTEDRDRARYKITLGVKTEAGPWYTDLALAMGQNGRSDNATFGKSATANINDKEAIYLKRAMVGWKATDWLTLEAGRMDNPLYTTPMVWDGDLTFEGFTEKFKYKVGNADLFLTASQAQYQGDHKVFSTGTGNTVTTELFATQGGAKYTFNDRTSAKAALTYTHYTHNTGAAKFSPGLGTASNATATANGYGVNNLDTIEVPAEVNYMATSNIGVRLFGDVVYNTDGAARAAAAAAISGATVKTSDDTAWLVGLAVGSAKDLKAFEANKMAKGDWSARIWYQDVGAYSVDPNAVDSDYMDSRVNMAGTIFKAQYNVRDNVYVNFAAGHASRKNNALGAGGAAQDLSLNLKQFNLYQLDLTYKF